MSGMKWFFFKSIGGSFLTFLLFFTALTVSAPAQTTLLQEEFTTLDSWDDLSLAVTWGGNSTPVSAFLNSGGTVALTGAAKSNSGYTSTTSLKTFTCLDYTFPFAVDHTQYGVTVDFRARWTTGSASNEGARFCILVNHSYPTAGLDLDLDDRYNDFDAKWWARPAYNMRIRGTGGSALLLYGGGLDPLGDYEIYRSGGLEWWLPGFVSAPGGGSPGTPTAKGWVQSSGSLYSATWRNYRYVITPTVQELWWDADNDGTIESNERAAVQTITSDPNNTAFFHFFESLNGVRLYWRGGTAGQAELDWLTITTNQPEPIVVKLASFTAEQEKERVRIEWRADTEINHAGYHLYRLAKGGDSWQRLTEEFITGEQYVGDPGHYVFYDLPPASSDYAYRLQSVDLSGAGEFLGMVSVSYAATAVAQEHVQRNFQLYPSYPNPFNASTTLAFELAGSETISLMITDVSGRLVRTLFTGEAAAGHHRLVWDGRNDAGVALPSGIYVYRLNTAIHRLNERMILLR